MKEVIIGHEIRKVLRERGMSVSNFAKQIRRSREATYGILRRRSINTELLRTVSEVLDYDFFQLYSDADSESC